MWWNGTSFLESDGDSWLKANCTKDGVVVDFSSNEKAKQCLAGEELLLEGCDSEDVLCSLIADSKGEVFGMGEVFDVVRFGDLETLLRVTAYVCRFVAYLKLWKKGDEFIVGQLRVAEICETEKMCIRYEQSIISKEKENFRKLTSSLNLFYDNEQVTRLNTRLNRNTKLHYENKNPLLLRRDSHFSKLIVLRSHEQMFHSGVESILSSIRLYYWIIRGRSFVKSILKNCYLCKLVLGKPVMPPPTLALLDYRLYSMFPFQTIGTDCTGPVYVRDVYSSCDDFFKCYFLLIICAGTRAVHIELTSDFSSSSSILALRRCFAR